MVAVSVDRVGSDIAVEVIADSGVHRREMSSLRSTLTVSAQQTRQRVPMENFHDMAFPLQIVFVSFFLFFSCVSVCVRVRVRVSQVT